MAEFFKPYDGVRRPKSAKRERLTVGAAAVQLTSSAYRVQPAAGATKYDNGDKLPVYALVQVLTTALNFTVDGTTPTAAVGYLAAVADLIHLNGHQEIREFRAIRNTGVDAVVEVTYFY